jgi:hypothetical protein
VATGLDGRDEVIGADARHAEKSRGVPGEKRLSHEPATMFLPDELVGSMEARRALAEIQAKVDEVLKKALPATVRFHPARGRVFSGVIVTEGSISPALARSRVMQSPLRPCAG